MIAALYPRKTNEQHGVRQEGKSVTRQIERARACATERGWTVDDEHIYVDDGISGAEFEARDGLMRLLGALKPKPAFGVLVVMNKNRLGREQYESAYKLKRFAQAGVRGFEYLAGRDALEHSRDRLQPAIHRPNRVGADQEARRVGSEEAESAP